MKRDEVYSLIDNERLSQDSTWRQGRPNEGQYQYSAPHVLLIIKLAEKLGTEWYNATTEDLESRFVKIAAVAVRALEEINKSKR